MVKISAYFLDTNKTETVILSKSVEVYDRDAEEVDSIKLAVKLAKQRVKDNCICGIASSGNCTVNFYDQQRGKARFKAVIFLGAGKIQSISGTYTRG